MYYRDVVCLMTSKITCTKKIGQNFRIFYNEAEAEAIGLEVGDIVEVTTTIIKKNEPDWEAITRKTDAKWLTGTLPPEMATRASQLRTIMKQMKGKYVSGIPEDALLATVGMEMSVDADFAKRMLAKLAEIGEVYQPKNGLWVWA